MSVNQCSTAMGDDDVSSGSINITDCLNQILDFSEAQLTCSICSDLMDNVCIRKYLKKNPDEEPILFYPCIAIARGSGLRSHILLHLHRGLV